MKPLSKEEQDKRKPLSPEILAGAKQDRVEEVNGDTRMRFWCRMGYHSWSKWILCNKVGETWHAQYRTCLHCGQIDLSQLS